MYPFNTDELIDYMANNLTMSAWKMDGAGDEKCWGVLAIRGNALPFTIWGSRNKGGINLSEKDNPMSVVISKEKKGYRHFMASEDFGAWPTLQKRFETIRERKLWVKSIIGDLPMTLMDSISAIMESDAKKAQEANQPKPTPAAIHPALMQGDAATWF